MVNTAIVFVSFLGVFTVGLVGSRMIYRLHLNTYAAIKMKRLGYSLNDLPVSFDKLVYMISLPTHKSDIILARKEDFHMLKDFDSMIYPHLRGIQVMLKTVQTDRQLIAYLPADQFRLPLLDQLLSDGHLTAESYRRIVERLLLMSSTSEEMIGEVYKQVQIKRFS